MYQYSGYWLFYMHQINTKPLPLHIPLSTWEQQLCNYSLQYTGQFCLAADSMTRWIESQPLPPREPRPLFVKTTGYRDYLLLYHTFCQYPRVEKAPRCKNGNRVSTSRPRPFTCDINRILGRNSMNVASTRRSLAAPSPAIQYFYADCMMASMRQDFSTSDEDPLDYWSLVDARFGLQTYWAKYLDPSVRFQTFLANFTPFLQSPRLCFAIWLRWEIL